MKSLKKKICLLNKEYLLVFFCCLNFSENRCQEPLQLFEQEEITLHDPQEANKYYFSLLPTTITTIILTLYDKEIRQAYKPEWRLGYRIKRLLKADKLSDAAFWGSFNITTYENSLFAEAFGEGNLRCGQLYLARGKDPTYSTDEYNCSSPLSLAIFAKQSAAACMVLAAGADPNYKPHEIGGSPLYEAAKNNLPECVRLLLTKGANTGLEGALQWGAHHNSMEMVSLLLAAGADPNNIKCGLSAFEEAAQNANTAMAELLLQYGAKINPKSYHLKYALEDALTWKHNDKLASILRNGGVEKP